MCGLAGRGTLGMLLSVMLCGPSAAEVSAARATQLVRLLHQDCGSCHGLTLQGGLGPALTPTALAGRSPDWLGAVIRDGVPGTAMPGWRDLLSSADIRFVVNWLRQGSSR